MTPEISSYFPCPNNYQYPPRKFSLISVPNCLKYLAESRKSEKNVHGFPDYDPELSKTLIT